MTVSVGQYSRGALAALAAHRRDLREPGLGVLAALIREDEAAILRAQKFWLDDCDATLEAGLDHLPDALRLPFEEIVLESRSSAEILTAHGQRPGGEVHRVIHAREQVAEDGALFIVIRNISGSREFAWTADEMAIPSSLAELGLSETRMDDGNRRCVFKFQFNDRTGLYLEEGQEESVARLGRAVLRVLCLLQLLACSNVATHLEPPPKKLADVARKRGRSPFFSYHVLTVPGDASDREDHGGTHASPRQHVRRGHYRRLPTGRTIFVNQCLVGDARRGLVAKSYLARGAT